MKKFHIELWQNGLRLIRSQPITGEDAEARIGWWRGVFGQKADIRILDAV